MIIDLNEDTIRALNAAVVRNAYKVDKFKRDYAEIKRRLFSLPDKARSDADLDVLLASKQMIALLDHLFFMGDEYRNIISTPESVLTEVDDDDFYTVYWKNGTRKVVHGPSVEIAYTRAGYTAKDAMSIEWVDKGVTNTHAFDVKKRAWVVKK